MSLNTQNIIEIKVKAILLGEFFDFGSWIKNYEQDRKIHGLTAQILHQDCNGFTTSGYDLKNLKNDSPYPVKTYLLVQDPAVLKPLPFKSTSNN